ncbi:hypothetical protein [Sphingomicrobium flavum]|uniref:hypothetical protein n=1 Tax=Sphingomicrobium flavum TaxID=1229164 RepID=UPI0021ADB27A|nr:hypothetical protein [Sphingomicrobium flavum]
MASLATPAHAQVMQGEGAWSGTFNQQNCAVSREYLRDGKPATVFIRSIGGASIHVSVREKGHVRDRDWDRATVELDGRALEASAYRYEVKGSGERIVRWVIPAHPTWLANIDRVTLKFGKDDYSFAFAHSQGVAQALTNCREAWIAAHSPEGGAEPRADLRSYFRSEDFPIGALRRGVGAQYQFILGIDEQGKVDRCDIALFVGDVWIPRLTCSLFMERAQFTPGLDANGNPHRSTVTTPPMSWVVMRAKATDELDERYEGLRIQRRAALSGRPLAELDAALAQAAAELAADNNAPE